MAPADCLFEARARAYANTRLLFADEAVGQVCWES